jgi:hypothetical protein
MSETSLRCAERLDHRRMSREYRMPHRNDCNCLEFIDGADYLTEREKCTFAALNMGSSLLNSEMSKRLPDLSL